MNHFDNHGPVFGAIVGDCFGAAYEFTDTPEPPFDIRPSVFGHPAGTGTDDTEQTIIVADAILEYGYSEAALAQIREGLIDWYLREPKDVGNTTRLALQALHTKSCVPKFVDISYGNGSLMRNSPIPTYWRFKKTSDQNIQDLVDFTVAVSNLTHPNPEVQSAALSHTFCVLEFMMGMSGWIHISRFAMSATDDGTAQHALSLAYIHASVLRVGFKNYLSAIISEGGDTDTNASIAGAIGAAAVPIESELSLKINPEYLKYSLQNFA